MKRIFLSFALFLFFFIFVSASQTQAQGTQACDPNLACTTSLVQGGTSKCTWTDGTSRFCCSAGQIIINNVCTAPTNALCDPGAVCSTSPISGSSVKCSSRSDGSTQYCCASGLGIVNGVCSLCPSGQASINGACQTVCPSGLACQVPTLVGANRHCANPNALVMVNCCPSGMVISNNQCVNPTTGTPSQPLPTPGTPVGYGSCGSCSTCPGTNHSQCRTDPTGACVWDPTGCGQGSSATPVPQLSCGEKCTSSSQCRNPSGNGSPVACINGTCQNTMCAEGMTIPGANCSCGANTRKCGQSCSGTVGLCGPGQGTCTYVNPPSHWYTGLPDCAWGSAAYCVGTQNGYSKVTCTTGDAPGGQYARDPSGKVEGVDLTSLAKSCQVCGNGDVEVGEQCDDGTLNGSTCGCTKTCEFFSASIKANGATGQVTVPSGSNVTLDWQTAGLSSCAAIDSWPSAAKDPAGSEVISNVTANGVYSLKCLQTGTNRPVITRVTVNVTGKTAAPTINFKINGSSGPIVYTKPVNWATQFAVTNAAFTWTTTGATVCTGVTYPSPQTVYPFPGSVPYTWSTAVAGWFLFDQNQPLQKTTAASLSVINDAGWNKYGAFTLVCTGPGGTTSQTILVVTDKTPSKQVCAAAGSPATPVPSTQPQACTMGVTYTSTGNHDTWKIGDQISFSTEAIPTVSIPSGYTVRYEGQVQAYRGSTQIKNIALTPVNATSSQFQPMTVQAVNATYYYRFRYCAKNTSGTETCSAWGTWTSPSGN